jgi:[ribosomal protein S5]-alanine N-acetyltransferase
MSTAYDWGDRLVTLPAQRVELRWLEDADVPALFTVFSDPEVMRYWSWLPYVDRAEAARLLQDIRDLFRSRSLFQWGIARRSDGLVVGTTTLHRLDRAHRHAEIGFALGRAHWGQGLASEAVTALLGFAFDVLGLHRLEAGADPRNHGSIRLLERQGFRREGYLRERYHLGGEIQDEVFFGLLRHEWTGRTG